MDQTTKEVVKESKDEKPVEEFDRTKLNLAQKILGVISELGPIEKAGKTHQYSYTKEVDVKKAVKPLFVKYGLIAIPSALNKEFIQSENKKGTLLFLTNIDFKLRVTDVDKPSDFIDVQLPASGMDYGGDKGPYKAITGGLKAALIALLLIETDHGNDPEDDRTDGKKAKAKPIVIPEDIQKLAQSMGHEDKSKVMEMAKHLDFDWVEVAKALKKMSEDQSPES